jgi:polyhydroxyalkanoate synthesis repressor PhaR
LDNPKSRVIKRYSNRKLYDTKDSRYVTLLQIGELVRRGEEVQIIDNKSKSDLTEVTLAQVLFEEQKSSTQKSVPLQTLKDLFQQRTEGVLTSLREGPIGRLIPGSGKVTPPAAVPSAAPEEEKPRVLSLVDQAKGTIEDFQHRVDERIKAVIPSLLPWGELQVDVKKLEARVVELEEALRKMNNGAK